MLDACDMFTDAKGYRVGVTIIFLMTVQGSLELEKGRASMTLDMETVILKGAV